MTESPSDSPPHLDPGLPPRLRLSGITKAYPSVVANDNVDLDILPGEIHAVLGENGAGKSTLMKIIYGVVRPDAGTVAWNGEPVEIDSPAKARRLGIGMVFQHFAVFETLTVAENIALALPKAQQRGLAARIREVSTRYGLPIDPDRVVHGLSVGERQRVEIVRCLLQDPQLIILDEPTSVLTPQAAQTLFETLRRLAAEGVSIAYISHKLDEIRALCHRATVLRQGRVTGQVDPRTCDNHQLARLMIGGELPHPEHHREVGAGGVSLRLQGLSQPSSDPFGTALEDINLELRAGQVLGIAGVSGNGQSELLALITGETRARRADMVQLDDKPVGHLGPAARRLRGLRVVPEERLGRGAVPDMPLTLNALLTAPRAGMVRAGLIRFERLRAFTRSCIAAYDVRCGGEEAAARSLSGGNLQKFIVGREVMQSPSVMVAAQPTWGVDVGAAARIRQALVDLRDGGAAVLVISEELDELFEVSDVIAVMAGGRLSRPRPTRETTVEMLGALMGGQKEGHDALTA